MYSRLLFLITMFLALCQPAGLLSQGAENKRPQRPGKPAEANKVKLFAEEDWYKQQEGKEQEFEGILQKVERGAVAGFGRFNPYRLKMTGETREVYMGGKLNLLDLNLGHLVRIRGKAVDMEVEGQQHREIWPAELVVLAKPAEEKDKPAGKARQVARQAMFVAKDDAKPGTHVLRSGKELQDALGEELQPIAKSLKLGDVDFSKQMVVLIKAGQTNAFGVRVEVIKYEVPDDGKAATVTWKYYPYAGGAAPPDMPGNPGALAVLDRCDGRVDFKKTVQELDFSVPRPASAPPARPGQPQERQ